MKVLVFEYFNSGVCESLPADNLIIEGQMMRNALLNDLCMMPDIDVELVHDPRLPIPTYAEEIKIIEVSNKSIEQLSYLLKSVDAFWPIAPETNGILEQICKICEHQNKLLLNTSSSAVKLTASKSKTINILHAQNIACVPTVPYIYPVPFDGDVVIKPDDGIGCENLHILQANGINTQMYDSSYIVQPYIQGQAASLSLLCVNGQVGILAANKQEMVRCGQLLTLQSCGVNMLEYEHQELVLLAEKISTAIPGLAGYVGVDIIVRDKDILVLEINPRLTDSYIGLHRSLGCNPAAIIIDSLRNQNLSALSFIRRDPIQVTVS